MRTMLALALGGSLLASAGVAQAAIFEESFDDYGTGTILNAGSSQLGSRWAISDGTIDYLAPASSYGDLCLSGTSCIDLDGSTGDAGVLATTQQFGPGTYKLSFDLWGSQRGDTNTVRVRLGDVLVAELALGSAEALGSYVFSNIVVTTTGALSFENLGGDNLGALVDNIAVTPLPAALPLLATALGAAGLLARSRRRSA